MTPEQIGDQMHSLIMEQASDTAEKLAQLEWERDDRPENFWVDDENGTKRMNEEAQDIFNVHYDEQMDQLTKLVTECLKLIPKP